ncbi:glycoside hydrolase family 2 TIM barrel-domain containing protein [Candidatus Omnitrophota bacterium]
MAKAFISLNFLLIASLLLFNGACTQEQGKEIIEQCDKDQGLSIIETRGKGKVKLRKYANGHWQLLVGNRPYFIKGIVYEPIKVGDTLKESNTWMNYDFSQNGKVDTAYDSWVDKNSNGLQDEDEPVVGDFQLLKEMGCNTIRIYHPINIKKEVLRDLYNRFGIRVMMGNFLGAYTWGSGAEWEKGTDYTDQVQREKMIDDVKQMVLEFKDEPYILFWMLGNENDMTGSYDNSTFNNTNAPLVPEAYAKFVNEVARMIHELDSDHPVGISNGSMRLMKQYAQFAQEIDIVGMNAYMGPYGFSSLWNAVNMDFDRPVAITEYGIDAYDQNEQIIDEDFQAQYHKGCWKDMVNNSFGQTGAGNSIGGFAYNWLDAWWFCGKPDTHDVEIGAWRGPAKDSWMNDEWLGICSQGDGKQSPFLRQLRKVYSMYKEQWRK